MLTAYETALGRRSAWEKLAYRRKDWSFSTFHFTTSHGIMIFPTAAPYKQESEVKRQIEQVQKDVNNFRLLSKTEPKAVGSSGVRLSDIDGKEIVPGRKYYLKMRQEAQDDEEHEVLYCFGGDVEACLGVGAQDLEVTCEILDGISYLMYANQYIVATNGQPGDYQVGTTSLLPTEAQSLQFHLTHDHMFLITKWNQLDYASVNWVKCAVGFIEFDQEQGQEPTKFYLEPIDQN